MYPDARDAFDFRLSAEFAFGSDLTRNARYFRRELRKLIDHRVDRVF